MTCEGYGLAHMLYTYTSRAASPDGRIRFLSFFWLAGLVMYRDDVLAIERLDCGFLFSFGSEF
jgi:hypothetical protein